MKVKERGLTGYRRRALKNQEYIGKDGRSHFHVTDGRCHCGWTIMNDFEWNLHLKNENAVVKS